MSKTRVIIDFDNTIVESSKTIYELYQKKIKDYSKDYHRNYLWNFEGLIPKEHYKECVEMFDKQELYDNLEIEKETLEALKWINENFEMIICTKHNPDTISMKAQWIRNNIPFAKKVIFLVQDNFDKSCIGNENDIIIDDKLECLVGERKLKLLFGNYGYNQLENVDRSVIEKFSFEKCLTLRVEKWQDIKNLLSTMVK